MVNRIGRSPKYKVEGREFKYRLQRLISGIRPGKAQSAEIGHSEGLSDRLGLGSLANWAGTNRGLRVTLRKRPSVAGYTSVIRQTQGDQESSSQTGLFPQTILHHQCCAGGE